MFKSPISAVKTWTRASASAELLLSIECCGVSVDDSDDLIGVDSWKLKFILKMNFIVKF